MIPDRPLGFIAQASDEISATAHFDVNGDLSTVVVLVGDVSINLLPEQARDLRRSLAAISPLAAVPS